MNAIKLPVRIYEQQDCQGNYSIRDASNLRFARELNKSQAEQIALALNHHNPMIQALQAIAGSKSLLTGKDVRAIAQNLLAKFRDESK